MGSFIHKQNQIMLPCDCSTKEVLLVGACTAVVLITAILLLPSARNSIPTLHSPEIYEMESIEPVGVNTYNAEDIMAQWLNLSFAETLPLPQLLNFLLITTRMLRQKAKDEPEKLNYTGVYRRADELLKIVKELKTDFQLAETVLKATSNKSCLPPKENKRCKVKQSVNELVSITINLVDVPEIVLQQLPVVLGAINDTYPSINVVVGVPENFADDEMSKGMNIKIKWIKQQTGLASDMWNCIIQEVKTPYVLIAKDILHFDKHAFLEQLVEFLVSTGAVAVGGASRDLAGYWKAGCYQMKVGVYTLKLEEGYRRSVVGCMKCDFIDGPFLVKTKDFKLGQSYHQTEGLLEWFFKKFLKNSVSLACPEIMFYHKHINMSTIKESKIQLFGRAMKLDTFVLPGKTLELTCSMLKFDCDAKVLQEGISLPRCCVRDQVGLLTEITNKLINNNISYYIEAGALLAATKIGNPVTWNMDSYVHMGQGGYELLRSKILWEAFNNFKVTRQKTSKYNKVIIDYNNIKIELFQRNDTLMTKTVSDLPIGLKNKFTLTSLGKQWLVSPTNPGKYSRRNYQEDYLTHKIHPAQYFQSCPESLSHICLDMYPNDGNLELYP